MPGPADEGPFLDLLSTPETGCMGSWPSMLCVWRGGRMRHGAGARGLTGGVVGWGGEPPGLRVRLQLGLCCCLAS